MGHQSPIRQRSGGDSILHTTKDLTKLQAHTSGAAPHLHLTSLPHTHPIKTHQWGVSRHLTSQAIRIMPNLQRTRRYGTTIDCILGSVEDQEWFDKENKYEICYLFLLTQIWFIWCFFNPFIVIVIDWICCLLIMMITLRNWYSREWHISMSGLRCFFLRLDSIRITV